VEGSGARREVMAKMGVWRIRINRKMNQAQDSTVQYSTVQYSTVQYSTVQYSDTTSF
jgi:hypothetical protein